MRTFTVEKTAYKFNELPERAKEHAREQFGIWFAESFDPNGDYDQECWLDCAVHGIKSYKIGSWDTNPINASFSAIDLDIDLLIARLSDSLKEQRNLYRIARAEYFHGALDSLLQVTTRAARSYYNGYITKVEFDSFGLRPRIESLCEKYASRLSQHVADCEHAVARAISAEFDYTTSDEYAQEMAEANEYEFDEYGNLI